VSEEVKSVIARLAFNPGSFHSRIKHDASQKKQRRAAVHLTEQK